MVPRKWVDDLKDVEGTRVCGHVSQPVPMCCRRRGHIITYLVFQIEKLLSAAATLRLVRSQIGACMDAAAQLLRTGLSLDNKAPLKLQAGWGGQIFACGTPVQ